MVKFAKSFIRKKDVSILLIGFLVFFVVLLQMLAFVEKRFVDNETHRSMKLAKQYTDYMRASVNTTISQLDALQKAGSVKSSVFYEDQNIVDAVIESRVQISDRLGSTPMLLENCGSYFCFVFDKSISNQRMLDGQYSLKDKMKDRHYSGDGLEKLKNKILADDESVSTEDYFLWDDGEGNTKEYYVISIIPAPRQYFEGTDKYWVVVLTIKEKYILQEYATYQLFVQAVLGTLLFMVWIIGSLLVYYKTKHDRTCK